MTYVLNFSIYCKWVFQGRNEPIPVMPFHKLCTIVGDAIKQVSSENIKKAFKQTLFSLKPDGSEDSTKESRRLL